MAENPYEAPHSEIKPSAAELRDHPTDKQLQRIGSNVKFSGICFLGHILLLFVTASASQRENNIYSLVIEAFFTILVLAFGCVNAGMLMYRIKSPLAGWGYALGALIPCANIVFLGYAMQKGTFYLRRHGMNFNLASMRVYRMESKAEDNRGTAQSSGQTPASNKGPSASRRQTHVERPTTVNATREVHTGNIALNAESLSQRGIRLTYDALLPTLQQFTDAPEMVTEQFDGYDGSYTVKFSDARYPITGPDLASDEESVWGRATSCLFDIVNRQLVDSETKFYAIGHGRDLAGAFLTATELESARQSAAEERDVPWLPAKLSA